MVTAAARVLPDELVSQLATGGRMVIPIGPPGFAGTQLITKTDDGDIHTKTVEMVRFVELKGQYGWIE
jgi:protein-L-isoaspartate(D-aspartate) O-methyltransferase